MRNGGVDWPSVAGFDKLPEPDGRDRTQPSIRWGEIQRNSGGDVRKRGYILSEKQKTYSQESINSLLNNRFPFVASEHVWDYTNLLADIQGLDLAKKEAVLGI